jgi:hypothetical protein
MSIHAWETSDDDSSIPVPRAHAWEVESQTDGGGGWESNDEVGVDLEPVDEYIEYLQTLYHSRVISAKIFCTIMRLAGAAGITPCNKLGMPSNAPTGHYKRHVDKTTSPDKADGAAQPYYEYDIPSYNKSDGSRYLRPCYMHPAHEVMQLQMQDDNVTREMHNNAIENHLLPPRYWDHILVKDAIRLKTPYPFMWAFYLDGLPYSLADSCIGLWVENVLTRDRYCFGTFRKRHICRCGCKGWCTFYAIFEFVVWSFRAASKGEMAPHRHDNQKWKSCDLARSHQAGEPMPQCIIIWTKLDWAEACGSLGFPTWADALRPCFKCNANFDNLFSLKNVLKLMMQTRCNLVGDYDEMCKRCEIHIPINNDSVLLILNAIRPDKRQKGGRGLALFMPLPHLGLRIGDRLEPCPVLPDVYALGKLEMPAVVVFWRPSMETGSRHRNPLFDRSIGLDPAESLPVDSLHALNLGVMNVFCKTGVWALLGNCYINPTIGSASERHGNALRVFVQKLELFYKDWDRKHPFDKLTRVTEFTMAMLGTPDAPLLKTKGAETFGILLFLTHSLPKFQNIIPDGVLLVEAGQALLRVVNLMNPSGENFNLQPTAIEEQLGRQHELERLYIYGLDDGLEPINDGLEDMMNG